MKKLKFFNPGVFLILFGMSFQAGAISEDYLNQLKEMVQHENPDIRETAVKMAGDIDDDEESFSLLKLFAQNEHYNVRRGIVWELLDIEELEEERELLFNQLARDENYKVRGGVAYVMPTYERRYEDGYGISILKHLAQDEDYWVRESVIDSAGDIGGEQGLEIIALVSHYEENASFSLIQFIKKLFSY